MQEYDWIALAGIDVGDFSIDYSHPAPRVWIACRDCGLFHLAILPLRRCAVSV